MKLVALDKLTYAGNLANLQDLLERSERTVVFVRGDICDAEAVERSVRPSTASREVVHFAAESHVDRSILGSGPFVQTNVVGTQVLLDVAKAKGVEKFLQVSTDEVYGTLPEDQAGDQVHRRNAAPAQQPLQRQQGGGGLPGASRTSTRSTCRC